MKRKSNRGLIAVFVLIPQALHRKFKVKLYQDGQTARELLTKFIRFYAGEDEEVEDEGIEAPETDRSQSQ